MRLFLLGMVLALPVRAQSDDTALRTQLIEWLKEYKGDPNPPAILKAFFSSPAGRNANPAQIQKLMAKGDKELLGLFYDKQFLAEQPLFVKEPNQFMVRALAGRKPGRALVPAMGQGRNAVYLARNGWEVTGYDLSNEGLAQARKGAAEAGVKLNAVLASHDEFDFGREQWDLIVLSYALIPMTEANIGRMRDSLRTGGWVVVEQFNAPPGAENAKGPANALYQSFREFRVLLYEDTLGVSDWAKAKSRLGRIVAEKE